ncbi:TIGR04076 family protein [Chloroflexota bacterium]
MAEQCEVVARVVSQEGTCSVEHKVGDEFPVGDKTPTGMCSWAFSAIFPFVNVLRFCGSFPWEEDPDKTTVACPDSESPVVFELRRLRK